MNGRTLPVYGDGKNVRDWVHVADHCAAIAQVLDTGREGEIYNVGARCERQNLEVVRAVLRAFELPESRIEMVTDRPGHDRRYALDPTKLERELKWHPARTFEEGLAETIAWYRAHPDWWQAAQSGGFRRREDWRV
jgi:dTDP-glucose 4,6-dehydratase